MLEEAHARKVGLEQMEICPNQSISRGISRSIDIVNHIVFKGPVQSSLLAPRDMDQDQDQST